MRLALVLLLLPAAAALVTSPLSSPALRRPALRTQPPQLASLAPRRTAPPSMAAAQSNPFKNPAVRGPLVVLGALMAHLILGTVYCFGNLISYAPESLRFFSGLPGAAGAVPDAVQVFPFALLSLNMGLPIGARLNKALGPRLTTLIGMTAMVSGVYIGSFQTQLLPFVAFFSVLSGIGIGIGYSTPMQAGWTWFPEKKGLVNGLVLLGFGAGAFIFNKVATGMAGAGTPWAAMLRKLAYIYAAVGLTGAALVKAQPPCDPEEELCDTENGIDECEVDDEMTKVETVTSPPEVCDPPGAGFREAVTSKRFALLWLMGLMVFTPGLTLSGLYKRFGMESGAVLADDRFQSAMGGLAAIANGLGRVFFGALVDTLGYVKGFGVTAAATAALMLAFPLTVNSKLAYASALIGLIFCLGGSMVMFITANAQIFGTRKAGEIYSLLYTAIALASLVGAKLTMRLLAPLGWNGIFKVLSAMGCAAAGLIYLLSQEKKKTAPWEGA